MPKREIVIYPEQVLKDRSAEIENIDMEIVNLIEDMTMTMYKSRGVGLAAPQVGVDKRLILVDPTGDSSSKELTVLLNPQIAEMEGRETDSEMCLSVPEFAVDIPRATRILLKGIDINGKEIEFEARDFLARIFQHEIDHLNGTVILDYASRLKRGIYLKKRKKGTL